MTERAVERTFVPVNGGGGRSRGWDDSGFVGEGVRVRSALLRLDGVFEPPYLVVDGEIDTSTLAPFTTALSSMLEHGPGDVWIDVEKLGFIDVGGLRALAAAACRLQLQDRRLVLRSAAPHLVKLMDLVGGARFPACSCSRARRDLRPAVLGPDDGMTDQADVVVAGLGPGRRISTPIPPSNQTIFLERTNPA